ncbi:hypothetical protein ILYODFUR_011895, partial [Ilyodon furcidens]
MLYFTFSVSLSDIPGSPTNRSKMNVNLVNSSRFSTSNCNSLYHADSNYFPYGGSPKVSRVRRFSSGGEEDGLNHNINKGVGRMILKEEMKARSGGQDNNQWRSARSSQSNSKETLNNLEYGSLNGSPRSTLSADNGEFKVHQAPFICVHPQLVVSPTFFIFLFLLRQKQQSFEWEIVIHSVWHSQTQLRLVGY